MEVFSSSSGSEDEWWCRGRPIMLTLNIGRTFAAHKADFVIYSIPFEMPSPRLITIKPSLSFLAMGRKERRHTFLQLIGRELAYEPGPGTHNVGQGLAR